MKVLAIKDMKTQEIIKTIDVTGQSQHNIEKCLRGVIHQMNQDKYVAYETDIIDEIQAKQIANPTE